MSKRKPQRHAGVGSQRRTLEEFKEALRGAGDRLVLRRFGDGFTGVEEYRGRRRILKNTVLDEQADIIEENFDGVIQWK